MWYPLLKKIDRDPVFKHQSGAHKQDRTADLILTKDALYLLSYVGLRPIDSYYLVIVIRRLQRSLIFNMERETRLELATFTLEG